MNKGVVSASSRSVVGDLDDLPTATVRLYQVQRPGGKTKRRGATRCPAVSPDGQESYKPWVFQLQRAIRILIRKTGMRKSPEKATPCLYCGKLFTSKGVYEHERHSCPHNKNRKKRSFGKARCKICGESFHQNSLRAHMATQHPLEFAREKANRKPSSRAAKRRELMRRHSGARSGKRAVASRETGRPQSNPPPQQKTAHPRHKSKERPEPLESKQPRATTPWSDPRHPESRNANRTRDAAPKAWAEMMREMSRAAAELPGKFPGHQRR